MKKRRLCVQRYIHIVYLGVIACLLCYIVLYSHIDQTPSNSKYPTILSTIPSVVIKDKRALENIQELFNQDVQNPSPKQLLQKGNTHRTDAKVKAFVELDAPDTYLEDKNPNSVNRLLLQSTAIPPLQEHNDRKISIKKNKKPVQNSVLNKLFARNIEETKNMIEQTIRRSSDFINFKNLIDPVNKIPNDIFEKMLGNFGKVSDLDFKTLANRFNNPQFASLRRPPYDNNVSGNLKSAFFDIVALINAAQNESTTLYRNDSCISCFQRDFNFIIENNHICDNRAQRQNNEIFTKIDLLIIVTTAYKHVNHRNSLRKTWLTHARKNSATSNVRYAFILGDTDDLKMKNAVMQENQEHRDIIMADFYDTYRNLTYKTITAMRWASTRCAHAQFVMKTDDDMWVHIPNLLRTISQNIDKVQHSLFGFCSQAKPIRSLKSKWYVSTKLYPHRRYPLMCSGSGYVMSTDIARDIYTVSEHIPFFPLEDVYVSFCMKNLLYLRYNIEGFYYEQSTNPCFYKYSRIAITFHTKHPTDIMDIWNGRCTVDNKRDTMLKYQRNERPARVKPRHNKHRLNNFKSPKIYKDN